MLMLRRCKLWSIEVNKKPVKVRKSTTMSWNKAKVRDAQRTSWNRVSKLGLPAPHPSHHLRFHCPQTKNDFYAFKRLEKSIVADIWKLYEIQMWVSISKVYWNTAAFMWTAGRCMAALSVQHRTAGKLNADRWPSKPNYCLSQRTPAEEAGTRGAARRGSEKTRASSR